MQIKMPYPDGLKIPRKKTIQWKSLQPHVGGFFLTQKSSWFWGVGTVLAPSCTFTGPILRNHIPWGLKRVSLSATSLGPSEGQRVSARCLTWCGTRGHGRIRSLFTSWVMGKYGKKNTTFGKLLSQYMWTQMRYCLHINPLSMESFDPQICHSDSIKALTIFLRMRRCSCKSNETSMDRAGPFNRMQPSTNSEASKSPLPDASLAN